MTAIAPSPWSLPSVTRRHVMPDTITDDIRAVLRDYGRLAVDVSALADDSDLYEAGLTSHASVTLMLALEERFNIEFPDRMLRRGAFASIAAIRASLGELVGADV
jgi:acyl carrier protein